MATEWRFEVRLRSKEALIASMALHQPPLSIRGLAKMCDPKKPDRHRPAIGHLVAGTRNTCSQELAKHIQEILGSDRVKFFDGEMYRVSQDSVTPTSRTGRRAA